MQRNADRLPDRCDVSPVEPAKTSARPQSRARRVEDERALERLLAAIHASTRRASRAIDDALMFARASKERIARMERDAALLRERARRTEF